MASRATHYQEAERLLHTAAQAQQQDYEDAAWFFARASRLIAAAQAHATLATAAPEVANGTARS